MLSNFFSIDLANAAVPQAKYDMPRKKGTKIIVDLASIMYWIMKESLHLYENNRGDGRMSNHTFKSASDGVDANVAGEIIIGMHKHKEEDDAERMTLANGHSRLAGFFQRLVNGELSAKELATEMYVTVTDNFMGSYQKVNSAPAHRTKDKIKNIDLAYGDVLAKIFQVVGEDCQKLIGENKWTVLSSIIFNLVSPNRNWFWPEVYQKRGPAMAKANELAGTLKIPAADEKRLIESIKFWYEVMDGIQQKADEAGIKVKKVKGNAGLFGYIVCDRMQSDPQLSSPPVLIKKVIRNLPKFVAACPELCRGDRDTVVRYTMEIGQLLNRKSA